MTYYEMKHELAVGDHVMFNKGGRDRGITGIVTEIKYGTMLKVVSDEGNEFTTDMARNEDNVNYRWGRYPLWTLIK